MDALLEMAPACIPDLIKVISTLSNAEPSVFYSMIDVVTEVLGESSLDPRLLAQYAISIVCAQGKSQRNAPLQHNNYIIFILIIILLYYYNNIILL